MVATKTLATALPLTLVWLAAMPSIAQHRPTECRQIVLELYVRDTDSPAVAVALQQFAEQRTGILVAVRRVDEDERNQARLDAIAKYYRMPPSEPATPLVYGLNQAVRGDASEEEFVDRLQSLCRMEVFVRAGCSRCAEAHAFLDTFGRRYPGLEIVYREVNRDASALSDMNRLVAKHAARAVSVPVFHVCDRLLVGFAGSETTGRRLDEVLQRWTTPCKEESPAKTSLRSPSGSVFTCVAYTPEPEAETQRRSDLSSEQADLPLPLPLDEGPASGDLPLEPPPVTGDEHGLESTTITLPLFGEVSVESMGLPLLTLAIGLVDGFNPCAIWVLLLLLSVLVNLHDRWRILLVAGVFIVVSGLAYLAFMAAWLNVFSFLGYLRPIQVSLGLLALVIGGVHIKDFFALHRGVSLSIPESAKPGIYAQTRRIVTAENVWGALVAATVLAVGVNIVELLCTAGLPAIYTEVLAQQDLSTAANYAYLLLYIAAYMFDDTLLVAAVVVTLDKRKLQEREGRWLKLISGLVITSLGLVMLLRPEWLF